ncbi:hypothetical protein AA313_de0207931 [Arthrobotrys entomopaga]|nr:hypothetical protein AA313_de0207931 [Arthrobotrys entomopaga]
MEHSQHSNRHGSSSPATGDDNDRSIGTQTSGPEASEESNSKPEISRLEWDKQWWEKEMADLDEERSPDEPLEVAWYCKRCEDFFKPVIILDPCRHDVCGRCLNTKENCPKCGRKIEKYGPDPLGTIIASKFKKKN